MNYKKHRILMVDDELGWCKLLESGLQENGFEVMYETNAGNASKVIGTFNPHAVLLDVLFNDINKGKATFKNIKAKYPKLAVAMLTNTVIEEDFNLEDYPGCAFAYVKDQLTSGTDDEYSKLYEKIRRAIIMANDTMESLEKELGFVVGKMEAMKKVCKDTLNVAPTNATILLEGESGVGKGLLAKAIRDKSKRCNKKYITKSCTDFSDGNMLISELFGHERGAFTGAYSSHEGVFEEAAGGTVFIDEVGDATLEAQGRLLRVLQEKTIRRMKGDADIKVDVRVLVATNKNLESLIRTGRFREDLFHRLNQYRITLPPLRERKEDIPKLVAYLVKKFNKEDGKNILVESENGEKDYLRPDVIRLLNRHNWPGNIRELENAVRYAMINAGDTNILLTSHFDLCYGKRKHMSYYDIAEVVDAVFEKEWYGKYKWEEFKTEFSKDWQKTILEKCITKLTKKQKDAIKYRNLAILFGIGDNTMGQCLRRLGIDWRKLITQKN